MLVSCRALIGLSEGEKERKAEGTASSREVLLFRRAEDLVQATAAIIVSAQSENLDYSLRDDYERNRCKGTGTLGEERLRDDHIRATPTPSTTT